MKVSFRFFGVIGCIFSFFEPEFPLNPEGKWGEPHKRSESSISFQFSLLKAYKSSQDISSSSGALVFYPTLPMRSTCCEIKGQKPKRFNRRISIGRVQDEPHTLWEAEIQLFSIALASVASVATMRMPKIRNIVSNKPPHPVVSPILFPSAGFHLPFWTGKVCKGDLRVTGRCNKSTCTLLISRPKLSWQALSPAILPLSRIINWENDRGDKESLILSPPPDPLKSEGEKDYSVYRRIFCNPPLGLSPFPKPHQPAFLERIPIIHLTFSFPGFLSEFQRLLRISKASMEGG